MLVSLILVRTEIVSEMVETFSKFILRCLQRRHGDRMCSELAEECKAVEAHL